MGRAWREGVLMGRGRRPRSIGRSDGHGRGGRQRDGSRRRHPTHRILRGPVKGRRGCGAGEKSSRGGGSTTAPSLWTLMDTAHDQQNHHHATPDHDQDGERIVLCAGRHHFVGYVVLWSWTMGAHANRAPALPVCCESFVLPLPKSSSS